MKRNKDVFLENTNIQEMTNGGLEDENSQVVYDRFGR